MTETGLRLLPARPLHASAATALIRLATPPSQHPRWEASRLERRIRSPNCTMVLALAGRCLSGVAVLDVTHSEAQLALLAVHPQYRRLGIGSALLGWLEKTATTAGVFTLHLKLEASNGAGRAFCFAHGYRERGQVATSYVDGTAAVRMLRDLRVNSEPA